MTCLGLYCGRLILENGTLSECGACPSGSRVNASSGICNECTNILSDYDWFYLLFMALLPLLSNYFFIDVTSKNSCKNITLHISATIEAAISLVITILSFQPIGTFTIRSCESTRLSDWYTILYNPSPDFINTIHCTQQAVYPLYSMVFLMYLLSLVTMLLLRSTISKILPRVFHCLQCKRKCQGHHSCCCISCKNNSSCCISCKGNSSSCCISCKDNTSSCISCKDNCSCCISSSVNNTTCSIRSRRSCCLNSKGKNCCKEKKIRNSCIRCGNSCFNGNRRFCTCSLYSALFFHPAITCVHAVFSGVIYYSYPYIVVVGSVITTAIHFASYRDQTPVGLLKSLFTTPRNVVILIGHWIIHAFGIISLLSSNIKTNQLSYLCLIPTPCLVYIISVYFTDPDMSWDRENYTNNNDSCNFAAGSDSVNAVSGNGIAGTSTVAVDGSFREMGDQKACSSSKEKEIEDAIYEEVADVAEIVPLKE